jgi:hypothetical protein
MLPSDETRETADVRPTMLVHLRILIGTTALQAGLLLALARGYL